MRVLTSRNNGFHSRAIDESSLDGLRSDIRPIDPMLHSIVVHHGHIVYVWHSEGDYVVVVGVVDVHTTDLDLTSIKKEFAGLWKRKMNRFELQTYCMQRRSRRQRGSLSTLTFAGASVRLQLHEVRAGTGEGLVEVDETKVGARPFTIRGGTWVWSWLLKKRGRY